MATTLPIDDIKDAMLDHIRQQPKVPLVIEAPTGSGKSTQVPIWLAEALDGPVLVVEPRRIACRALGTWVASLRNEAVGESVGYRIRFDDKSSPRTRVLYATTGVVLRMITGADGHWPWAAVVLDEFHERSEDIDLIAALLRDTQGPGQGRPLIFTSATLDADRLSQTVGGVLLRAEGRSFPVDIMQAGGPTEPTSRDLESRVQAAVSRVITEDDGEVLVFLPGKREISGCQAALSTLAHRHKLDVLPVHASLPSGDMARVFDPPRAGRRRIFLSTNVAETSVTLPGVTAVIDSGLARMRIHRGGRSTLAMVPIAQSSALQRAGRAGRVAPGRCIQLWSSAWTPSKQLAPEIERIELDDLVLRAAGAGIRVASIQAMPWVTPPPEFALQRALDRLHKQGLIDTQGLTPRGRTVSSLPTGTALARLVADPPKQLGGVLANLAALLERRTQLFMPLHKFPEHRRVEIDVAREKLLQGCDDEVTAQLKAMDAGEAGKHGLDKRRLTEARRVSRQLRDAVAAGKTADVARREVRDALVQHILRRWPEAGFVLRPRADKAKKSEKKQRGEPWSNGDIELSVGHWSPPYTLSAGSSVPRARFGLVLDLAWIGSFGVQVRGVGNMLLPCTADQMVRAGIGTTEIGEVKLVRKKPVAMQRVTLAGRVLHEEEAPLHGQPLREAVADLILQGRLVKGGRDRMLDGLHLWALLQSWPPTIELAPGHQRPEKKTTAPTDAAVWLLNTLTELGLESADEIQLIGPDDLVPDVASECGVPGYLLEGLLEEFPRLWSCGDAVYSCAISPRSGRVLLEPANGIAKRSKDPDSRQLPSFRGFRVIYRKASREVRLR